MEENKVREKLAAILFANRIVECSCGRADCSRLKEFAKRTDGNALKVADAILQSPDLRVTLVEPRFSVDGIFVREDLPQSNYAIASFASNERAREYADWLNSKEPK